MPAVSNLSVPTRKAETSGFVVVPIFVMFVVAVLAVPLAMVWAANTL
jgi:hypothetical protein